MGSTVLQLKLSTVDDRSSGIHCLRSFLISFLFVQGVQVSIMTSRGERHELATAVPITTYFQQPSSRREYLAEQAGDFHKCGTYMRSAC